MFLIQILTYRVIKSVIITSMLKHVAKNKNNGILEKLVLAVAIIEPLSTIPQIVDIFSTQNATAISLITWLLFAVAAVIWLAYGIKIKNTPLIVSSLLWVITESIVVVGILLYS